MDRKRVADEVIEVLCHKLPQLPLPGEDPSYNYEKQRLVPDVTDNQLDVAEVQMDLEDAFDVAFVEEMPGEGSLITVGDLIDYIHDKVK